MKASELVGLNTKWYRYKNGLTQEQFAEKANLKMAYISIIECGHSNASCNNLDVIASILNIRLIDLFNEETALLAKKLPNRIDKYKKENSK